jgi:hypothetical protein
VGISHVRNFLEILSMSNLKALSYMSSTQPWLGWEQRNDLDGLADSRDWSFQYSMVNEEEKKKRTCLSRKK